MDLIIMKMQTNPSGSTTGHFPYANYNFIFFSFNLGVKCKLFLMRLLHSPWGLRSAPLAEDPRPRRSSGVCSQTHVCIPHKWQRPPGRTELWVGGGGPTWMPYVPGHTATQDEENNDRLHNILKEDMGREMKNQPWAFSSRKRNIKRL